MKVLAIYLHPDHIDDDINLTLIEIADFDPDTVYSVIQERYDVEKETFHYEYEKSAPNDGTGGFTTVDEDDFILEWWFETREF